MSQAELLASSVPDLPPLIKEQLEGMAQSSFMLPSAARKAMELAKNPDCDLDDFLEIIQCDPKLAQDILCIANSAAFSPNQRIGNLQQAVVRLGFRQCRNLILAAAFSSLMSAWPAQLIEVRDRIWRKSYTTALFAQRINRLLQTGFEGEEFTAGLIHDFGAFALALCNPAAVLKDTVQPGRTGRQETDSALLERERVLFGADHCEVGAFVAWINDLPESLAKAIRFHHTPEQCPLAYRPLCSMVAASQFLARNFLTPADEAPPACEPSTADYLTEILAASANVEDLLTALPSIEEQVQSALGSDPLATIK